MVSEAEINSAIDAVMAKGKDNPGEKKSPKVWVGFSYEKDSEIGKKLSALYKKKVVREEIKSMIKKQTDEIITIAYKRVFPESKKGGK